MKHPHIFGWDFMRLRVTWPQFSRKHLERQLFSLLAFLRFIRLRVLLLACSCFILFSWFWLPSVIDAIAATPVPFGIDNPTPVGTFISTATWRHLFNTSTPAPTLNYDCPPGGVPGGWGTVTPDHWWLINCSQCLGTATIHPTQTSWPTTIAQATMTAAAGGGLTPTLTTTATAWPTPVATAAPGYFVQEVFLSRPLHILMTGQTSGSDSAFLTFPDMGGATLKSLIFSIYDGAGNCRLKESQMGTMDNSLFGNGSSVDITQSSYWCWNVDGTMNGCGVADDYITSMPFTNKPGSYQTGFLGVGPLTYANQTRELGMVAGRLGGACTDEFTIGGEAYLLFYGTPPQPTGTPAPTATPLAPFDGYCSAVDGEDPAGGGDDGFELPDFLIGEPTCFIIPQFEADLTLISFIPGLEWLATQPANFPGFSLCMFPIIFGTLKIFGVSVALDTIANVMGGVLALRIMLRS